MAFLQNSFSYPLLISTPKLLAHQYLKHLILQMSVGVVYVLGHFYYYEQVWQPLIYGLSVGFSYSFMLFIGFVLSSHLGKKSPEIEMATLMGMVIFRFLVIGSMFVFAFTQWPEHPVAIFFPFLVMLISPIALLPLKKKLTD